MARTPARPDPQTVISGLKGAGHGAAVHVKTTANVADLAGWLLSPFRDRVVVIVTVPFDRGRAFIDADAVAADYPDRVEVYLIVNGPLTYQLTDLLPDETGVYGGATRIFPVGWHGHRPPGSLSCSCVAVTTKPKGQRHGCASPYSGP